MKILSYILIWPVRALHLISYLVMFIAALWFLKNLFPFNLGWLITCGVDAIVAYWLCRLFKWLTAKMEARMAS